MDNLDTAIALAFRQGSLLTFIDHKLKSERSLTASLCEGLVELHNSGEIDVISSFKELRNEPKTPINFFSIRNVLEEILPKLRAPVLPVIDCVPHLVNQAGPDRAAGMLLPPFTDFCSADQSRPVEALALVENSLDQYIDLLVPVIVAGARLDVQAYLVKALQLSQHDDLKMRRAAVFSIGRIENLDDRLSLDALVSLEKSAQTEIDDQLLGNVIRSTFGIYKQDRSQENRVEAIIRTALPKGQDLAIHAAAELLSFDYSLVSQDLLKVLLVELTRVNPEHKGTLNLIDHGVSQLLERDNWEIAVEFLEKLLLKNADTLSLEELESTTHQLFRNVDNQLSRLLTKWFMKGDLVLCDGIRTIVELAYEHDLSLAVAPSEFDQSNPIHIIFLARKSIGYLFSKPITVASIVISLLEYAVDEDVHNELSNLLFDPLLINYPGRLKDYLIKNIDQPSENPQLTVQRTVQTLDEYFAHLKSAGKVSELHPSQSQRDAYRRHFSRLMSESMANAKRDSVFLSLVSTSVILYGSKSIDYVYGTDGAANRMEIPLQSHSTTVELPRIGNLDSLGLDYILRVFRVEQLIKP